jgi:archaellum component FlaG (FlaF/FlaG flagellin family)
VNNGQVYFQRLQKLQQEFQAIKNNLPSGRAFKPHQEAVFNFVMDPSRAVEFDINGYTVVIYVGNDGIGFRHILLRHYCSGCDGEVTARDILNIGNVIANDIELPGKKGRLNFIQNKNDKKYTVVVKPKSGNKLIFNFFSS